MKKPKKHPGGRPTVMTPEVLAKLQEMFSYGCDDELACFQAGVSIDALYDYCRKNPEFGKRKELLKRDTEFVALRTVKHKVGLTFQNSIDYLKRKRKDEFSERSEVTGKNDSPIELVVRFYEPKK